MGQKYEHIGKVVKIDVEGLTLFRSNLPVDTKIKSLACPEAELLHKVYTSLHAQKLSYSMKSSTASSDLRHEINALKKIPHGGAGPLSSILSCAETTK